MNELALFAGAGGGILGGHLLGWRTVCAVEYDPYARSVLLARQRDGCLPRFPIWDDVRTFNGHPWCGHVDVVSGGFPCQDISAAGRGAGIDGARSGLWREMARIVGEVRPRFVWVENSPLLVSRGLAVVLGDLAKMGYDARWGVVGAHHAGAPHKRDRCWVLANAKSHGTRWWKQQPKSCNETRNVAHAASREDDIGERGILDCSEQGWKGGDTSARVGREDAHPFRQRLEGQQPTGPAPRATDGPGHGRHRGWWATEPKLGRVAHGLAAGLDVHGTHAGIDVGRVATGIPKRVHRLRCIGNGQVPAAMIRAWKELAQPPPTE